MPYDVTQVVQDTMFDNVRNWYGVEALTLPDVALQGVPSAYAELAADERCPGWPQLAQTDRAAFDLAVTFTLAYMSLRLLKTRYAPGEGPADARAGQYDWRNDEPEILAQMNAMWSRASRVTTDVTGVVKPPRIVAKTATFGGYGSSKSLGYTTPSIFLASVLGQLNPYLELTGFPAGAVP
jgi:hypothetical protein